MMRLKWQIGFLQKATVPFDVDREKRKITSMREYIKKYLSKQIKCKKIISCEQSASKFLRKRLKRYQYPRLEGVGRGMLNGVFT